MATNAKGMSSVWYTETENNLHASNLLYRSLTDFDSLEQEEKLRRVISLYARPPLFQNSFYLAEEGTLDLWPRHLWAKP